MLGLPLVDVSLLHRRAVRACGAVIVVWSHRRGVGAVPPFPCVWQKNGKTNKFSKKKIGGVWGFRWLVRASRVWAGWLSKEVLPDLVPSRLIGHVCVLFSFLVAPSPI